MGNSEKKLLLITVGLIVAWIVLFYMMVYPLWTSREEALKTAQTKVDRLQKLTKGGEKTWEVPAANTSLDEEAAALEVMLGELKTVQTADLGPYKLTAVGEGRDPNTYFARLRRELTEKVRKESSVQIAATIVGDLGFRDKATQDPVAVNLVRLYALDQFFDAAKAADVESVTNLQFPGLSVMERPEGLEIEKLVQVPISVRIRITEAAVGPLLYHLAPNPKHDAGNRYFCIRSFEAEVRDDKSGVLEVSLNLGTLFTDAQLKEQGIVVKDDRRPIIKPFHQPFGQGY